MLLFGIDIPLVEILFLLAIITFIILIEAIIIISLLVLQMNKTKKMGELMEKLSEILLEIKKAEITELDKIKRK
jgi:uncharacterized protein YggT (Ycf19 family)